MDHPPRVGPARQAKRAGQVHPVEAQHDVRLPQRRAAGVREDVARRAGVERVARRERGPHLQVGQHAGPERFGEADAPLPVVGPPGDAAREDDGPPRAGEPLGGATDGVRIGRRRRTRLEAGRVGDLHGLGQRGLLERRVETDVHGPARGGPHELARAEERLQRRRDRGRLVVPLGVVADEGALVLGRVDPVDPRPAPRGVHRARRAEDQRRHPVAPQIEDRHRPVHEPDVGVEDHRHRAPGDLRVAVGDGDRRLLVEREQHRGVAVAQVVDQAVVEAAVARPRVEGDPAQVEAAQQRGDGIAAPPHGRGAGPLRAIDGRGVAGHAGIIASPATGGFRAV